VAGLTWSLSSEISLTGSSSLEPVLNDLRRQAALALERAPSRL
jgi:hypothetical protein